MPKFVTVNHNAASRNGEPFKEALQQPKIAKSVGTPMPKELKIKMNKILNKFRSKA